MPLSLDWEARFGRIEGHRITERAGPINRMAFCECGWHGQTNRRGNAWAQTSALRKQERDHIRAVTQPLAKSG